MKVTRIVILERKGHTDEVYLHTDLPRTFPEDVSPEPMSAAFQTTKGWARDYVRKHFPDVPTKVIDADDGSTRDL